MPHRQNKRPSRVAKSIFMLIGALVIGTLALSVYIMMQEPVTRPDQIIPAQAAEQAGALPRPAAPVD